MEWKKVIQRHVPNKVQSSSLELFVGIYKKILLYGEKILRFISSARQLTMSTTVTTEIL